MKEFCLSPHQFEELIKILGLSEQDSVSDSIPIPPEAYHRIESALAIRLEDSQDCFLDSFSVY